MFQAVCALSFFIQSLCVALTVTNALGSGKRADIVFLLPDL